jgi:hypothetical protein
MLLMCVHVHQALRAFATLPRLCSSYPIAMGVRAATPSAKPAVATQLPRVAVDIDSLASQSSVIT